MRELQNAIERAVALASDCLLEPKHFKLGQGISVKGVVNGAGLRAGKTVAEMERKLIRHTLEHCDQNRKHAAEMLGMSVRTLRNKLKDFFGQARFHRAASDRHGQ